MLRNFFGFARIYKKLPPHHSFAELAGNMEKLADDLIDRSLGSFVGEGHVNARDKWEWQFGNDLKMLLSYARMYVPPDADGLHSFAGAGERKPHVT
jgi:hypothetical protein